jgi:hypothetical protein
MWAHLTERNLIISENVTAIYIKRVLQVLQYIPLHLVYTRAKEILLLEDLSYNLLLPSTEPYNRLCSRSQKKQYKEDFYSTDVILNKNLMEADYE